MFREVRDLPWVTQLPSCVATGVRTPTSQSGLYPDSSILSPPELEGGAAEGTLALPSPLTLTVISHSLRSKSSLVPFNHHFLPY